MPPARRTKADPTSERDLLAATRRLEMARDHWKNTIVHAHEKRGLSSRQIADVVGISHARVMQIVNERKNP